MLKEGTKVYGMLEPGTQVLTPDGKHGKIIGRNSNSEPIYGVVISELEFYTEKELTVIEEDGNDEQNT